VCLLRGTNCTLYIISKLSWMIRTELDFKMSTYANNSTFCQIHKAANLVLNSMPVEPLCAPDMVHTATMCTRYGTHSHYVHQIWYTQPLCAPDMVHIAKAFEPSRSRCGGHFLRYCVESSF